MDFSVEGVMEIIDLRAALSVLPYIELPAHIADGITGYAVSDEWLTIKTHAPHMSVTGKPTGAFCDLPIGFKLMKKSVLGWSSSPTAVWGKYLIIPANMGSHPDHDKIHYSKQANMDYAWVTQAASSLWKAWVECLRHCTMEFVDGEWMIHHPVHGNIKVVKE